MIRGDRHNFGRRVVRKGRRIVKPRTLLWEWLILARTSPLRRLFDDIANREGAPEAFAFLPDLAFFPSPSRGGTPEEVEVLTLAPIPRLSRSRRVELARAAGRAIALFSFLGLADLHWENLAIGLDERGAFIFAPLDVEMLLADLALPTETKLIPDPDPEVAEVCRHAAGARRLLPFLGKPVPGGILVHITSSYLAMVDLLERHAKEIAHVFGKLPWLRKAPLRVLLRGTDDYVKNDPALFPPLLDAEVEQLERGDIPYFFRRYGDPRIHYFADRALRSTKTLPLLGDVPRLEPLLPIERALRTKTRARLRDEGVFALLGAFDHPLLDGRFDGDGVRIDVRPRTLSVRLTDGETLTTRRRLVDFVLPIYLDCRCGEVRTPLVPPVTRCVPKGPSRASRVRRLARRGTSVR